MNRRELTKLFAAAPVAAAVQSGARSPGEKPSIQLHVDLEVDPARASELLANFRNTFRPAIRKQPGFVDVELLRLRSVMSGKAPVAGAYRLLISFETEEQRQKWIATDTHQQVWPGIQKTLAGGKYSATLYDVVT